MRLGIMQGRLLPPTPGHFQCFPRGAWAEEFALAAAAGLSCIEWIYDVHGADVNPLATDEGVERMLELSRAHGIDVHSICADWFMERPLVCASEADAAARIGTLEWLIGRASRLGVHHIVLPFVDASRIETEQDSTRVVQALRMVLPAAEATGVELHLETSLEPRAFAALLSRLPHDLVRANYDSGNSASLGYAVSEEFDAYGDRVGSIHIKDRLRGGATVPLGRGDADLPALVSALTAIGYDDLVVLQVARGVTGEELAWATENRAYVERLLGIRLA